jgi:hypothetical protein
MMNKVPGGKVTLEEKSLLLMSKFLIEVIAAAKDLMVLKFSSVKINVEKLSQTLVQVNG